MQKLYEIAFKEGSSDSESCCTTQGLIARFVQQFNDRQKSTPKDDRWDCSGDDDDDIIVNEISDDDENEESKSNQAAAVVEILIKMIEPIQRILEADSSDQQIKSSYREGRVMPLGRTKLRAVELLQAIVSLKKANIITAVGNSTVMAQVLKLIEKHTWNNMVQLKCQLIFEDVFSSDISNAEKVSFLKSCGVTSQLIKMSDTSEVQFYSGNKIRNGHMGFVIKLANSIVTARKTID